MTFARSPLPSAPLLDELAAHIARYGIAASAQQLEVLVGHARRRGVAGTIRELLLDPATPDVVRERAAARVIAKLRAEPVSAVHPAA